MDTERLSSKDLAEKLGIGVDTVNRRRRKGQTDEEIAALTSVTSGRNDPHRRKREKPETSLVALERRKLEAETIRKELDLAERRGQLIDVTTVEQTVDEQFRSARDKFLSLPDRLASQVAAISDPRQVRQVLRDEVISILTQLSGEGAQPAAG